MKIQTSIRIALFVFALGLGAAPLFGQSQLLKRTTFKTDKFDFGVGGTVAIAGAPKGSIRVEGSQKNEIEISAEIEVQAATEADLAKLAEVTTFVLDESLGRASIMSVGTHDAKYLKQVAKKFPKTLIGLPFRIDYVVKVPHYCDLQIDGGKGDLTITGVEGSIRVNYLDTNAKIALIGGGLNGTFGSGTVELTMPNRSWRGNAIDTALTTGTMSVAMPMRVSAELDATILHTGKIENAFADFKPRDRKVPFTDKLIEARAGSGGVPMKFTVGDGTLKLMMIGKE
jgi:hypothetical protein